MSQVVRRFFRLMGRHYFLILPACLLLARPFWRVPLRQLVALYPNYAQQPELGVSFPLFGPRLYPDTVGLALWIVPTAAAVLCCLLHLLWNVKGWYQRFPLPPPFLWGLALISGAVCLLTVSCGPSLPLPWYSIFWQYVLTLMLFWNYTEANCTESGRYSALSPRRQLQVRRGELPTATRDQKIWLQHRRELASLCRWCSAVLVVCLVFLPSPVRSWPLPAAAAAVVAFYCSRPYRLQRRWVLLDTPEERA